ncbi:hypothetical protein LGN13_02830 [Burkholderia multivorans]|uniref:hypothetical protein n=1 Tax=Burkholderia multivorans TaxID=87883 RepID=UPI0011246B05|nr:hypothetical protein [Burkholderia multivorans]MBH9660848.1 hypothetical protein [Burkholderia multivorans]MBU9247410.1 hypothetical protein [Burkholderia multivorans]MBU9648771.1 hypothetical protein [Burkholderia multivorans]MCA8500618.1 hypothetical protein [Burkholderia multivorans]MCO7336396.1 hypothetical protein [Burkholderia multivorans]
MSIIFSVIKWCVFSVAVAGAANAFADEKAPTSIQLSNGRQLQQTEDGKRLIEVDAAHHRTITVKLPTAFRRTVASSSGIGFPSATSKVVDGKELVLVVVSQSSSNKPMGFCGAGEESTLYALEVHGSAAAPVYSMPVQSCLHSVSLNDNGGYRSPWLAIEWIDNPLGFKITWTNIDDAGNATREYRYNGSTFSRSK